METESPPVQIALVEDDVLFQQSLRRILEADPSMHLRAPANNLREGLALLQHSPADILLVDLGLPDGSGLRLIAAARLQWPQCSVVVNTTYADERHVVQSIEAGAVGYLLKDSQPRALVEELRSVLAGGSPISPLIARQVLNRFQRAPAPSPRRDIARVSASSNMLALMSKPKPSDPGLSDREVEVLRFVMRGLTAEEIAQVLGLSKYTVQTFVRRCYAKLNVQSKAEAIYEARAQGLLD